MFYIKLRKKGEKRFKFMTPNGGEIMLKIHAARIPANSIDVALEILRRDNPEFEFKSVPVYKEAVHATKGSARPGTVPAG